MELPIKCKNQIVNCLIDDEDYEKIKNYKWIIINGVYTKYVKTNISTYSGKQKTFYIHRLIMDCPKDKIIDHINHNGLDNRKSNLRICTRSQNQHNQYIQKRKKTSQFKGVHFAKEDNLWIAQIRKNKIRFRIGYYHTQIEAAIAYNKKAFEIFGQYAYLNKI